jgi:hypothetical protein
VHLITSSSYSGATARVLPPSELSDGTSVASDEGSRVDTRKKPVKVRTRAVAPTLPSGDKEVPRGCFNADFTGDTDLGGGDGTSVASDEGSRVDTRKKPVKVSFDDEAEVVNAAYGAGLYRRVENQAYILPAR